MAWSTSDRRSELPSNWESELVPLVYRRDGAQCTYVEHGERCPRRGYQDARGRWRGLQVDHKRPGCDHSPSNLRLLCSQHHGEKSAQEGVEARAAKAAEIHQKYRRSEDHPSSW